MNTLNQEFTQKLTRWFVENQRDLPWREDKDPYHVWVSEIMLQQTRVEAVREYYLRFMKELPTIGDLATADEETLLKLWQGLGYYNRIRNMHKAAVTVMGELDGEFPVTFEGIRSLSGIGDYTAGAIGSICFDLQVPAVDGNVLRVMSRILEDDSDIKAAATKKKIGAVLQELYPAADCGDFTQGLIELGAIICVPNGQPKCDLCPVAEFCKARANGTQMQYPVKSEKKPRKVVEKAVFILRCIDEDGTERIAVRKRPKSGLLAGLYEYPNVDVVAELSLDEAAAQAEAWDCKVQNLTRRNEAKHIFTHVEWHMTGYYFDVHTMGKQFRWVSPQEMEEEVPIPSAFGYFL
ncbi:MAG: A/G-specific adenine glycosylase [Firmicutes bacterium]|nr:A/G-specific adenine glycosylase [Bacillota bacterium]